MKKTLVVCALLAGMLVFGASVSVAAKKAEKAKAAPVEDSLPDWANRIGVGLNLSRVDVRYEIDAYNAADVYIDFDLGDGDTAFERTTVGSGAYYLRRLGEPDPVAAHILAGIGVDYSDVGGTDTLDFIVFGGIGAQYFFPGTRQFSIEANVGIGIHNMTSETAGISTSGFAVRIDDLTRGVVMLRYYFK